MRTFGPGLVLVTLLGLISSGCTSACTSHPTWATLDFAWTQTESALITDLTTVGWTFAPPAPNERPRASYETNAGPIWVTIHITNQTARLQFEGPTLGTTTYTAAREELEPGVKPLETRYDATPTYHAGTQQCNT